MDMDMKLIPTDIPDVILVEPRIFRDSRGFFTETYQQSRYRSGGILPVFVQDNLSYSTRGTLRGLHFQIKHPQDKLVQVIKGKIFDVAVDIRPGSETFGKWIGVHLSGDTMNQLFIPKGFAHGFCVLSETALFSYKCSDFYKPDDEGGILWSDPGIRINWPVENPILSDKDRSFPCLKDLTENQLPEFEVDS